eukprot:m.59346 g.59346  ORF g.59346 m.59346 type:complete len:219 (+) comp19096_c0_seq3:281-937(+)
MRRITAPCFEICQYNKNPTWLSLLLFLFCIFFRYLPPICDPIDGHLLVDGGYMNVLPVDVMKHKFGANTVFAIDVAGKESKDLENFGDHISGFYLMWRRWNPFLSAPKIPDMGDISSRLAFMMSNLQLQQFQNEGNFEYLRPPVDDYGTLAWSRAREIEKLGYEYAVPLIEKWKTEKSFSFLRPRPRAKAQTTRRPRFNSLTDFGSPTRRKSFEDIFR